MQNKQAMYALALGFLGMAAIGTDIIAAPRAAFAAPVSASNTITSVSVTAAGEATKITIVGTQPFTPDVRSLLRPSATVITIEGTWNAGRTGYTNVRKNNVYNVRAGRFSNLPTPTVRIVANTRGSLIHAARPLTSDNTQWEILVGSASSVHTAVSSAAVAKTMLGIREPASTPLLLTPPTAPPAMTASAEKNAPGQASALRLAADLARPIAAPKNGPYPALLRTPTPAVRASVPPSVPGMRFCCTGFVCLTFSPPGSCRENRRR